MVTQRKTETTLEPAGRETGPERMCAVTREHGPQVALLRFALAPDGKIITDAEGRLPGRGVWLTCSRKVVETAIQTKAFAKSLKQQVEVPGDLAQQAEGLLQRRLSDYLSLANKAGQVVAGFQQVDAALEKGSVGVLLHGSDAAADGCRKLDRKFRAIQRDRGLEAPVIELLTVAQMSLAMGRPSVVHAGLIPGGLTERFLREAERLSRFRSDRGISDQSLPIEPSIELTNEG